jgi:hypothetical protein
MTTTAQNVYIPGVCNIGPAEIRSRRRSGFIGLVVTVLFIAAMVVFDVPWPWRLLVILPAALGATGFLQSALHFCVKFGTQGLFNMDRAVGDTEAVHETEYRRKDQRKAIIIVAGSLGIALVIALVTVLLP